MAPVLAVATIYFVIFDGWTLAAISGVCLLLCLNGMGRERRLRQTGVRVSDIQRPLTGWPATEKIAYRPGLENDWAPS
jgi:hypothetical protein